MYYAYSFLLTLVFLAWSPSILLGAMGIGRRREGWRERLGRYPEALLSRFREARPVWMHAVSVGEVSAASVLAERWTARRPALPLLVSTVTATGREVATRAVPHAAGIVYFPLDLRVAVRRALATVRPLLVLLTETEIWPNFLRACAASQVPVAIINGRISSRSFRRYRLVRPFIRRVLQCVDLFCMQTAVDAERIVALGASPDRVHVVGNLKFDATPRTDSDVVAEQWRRDLHIEPGQPVIIAGSTHSGEEEVMLRSCLRLQTEFRDLLLILAPRHPDRLSAVEGVIAASGLAAVRRSEAAATAGRRREVILLDTVGELSSLYAVASVAFVGGSLVRKGGHNLLEPALHGRPVLFGPHMENFTEASALFLERGAALEVHDEEELVHQLARLLRDPATCERMSKAAVEALAAHRGACERTLALLERFLM